MKHSLFFYISIVSLLMFVGCRDQSNEPLPPQLEIENLFAINDNNSVTLGWTAPLNGTLASLEVHRSDDGNFIPSSTTLLTNLSPPVTRFIDTTVTNGTMYYYRLVPIEKLSDNGVRVGTATAVTIGKPMDYSSITTIRYSEHIQSIFNSGCAVRGCHVGSSGADHYEGDNGIPHKILDHNEQFSLKSWEDIVSGGPHGVLLIPFKASKSHLVFHVNTDTLIAPVSIPHMPLNGFKLPNNQVETLIRWINEGAANDVGAIAFTVSLMGKILVANQAEDLVTVIDVASNLVARYVLTGASNTITQVPYAPHHIRADRQGKFFYVTLINAQEVWKFSATTNEFIAKVSVPPSPADVILTSSGDTAIVTNFSTTGQIAVLVDTKTMQVIKTFTAGSFQPFVSFSHGALLSHDGKHLYITNQGSGNLIDVHMTDGSKSLITLDTNGTPTSNTQPYLSDESPDGRFIYSSCYATNEVRVLDQVVDSTRATRIIPVGTRPLHVKVSPDGQYVLTANQGSDDITFIRTSDFTTSTVSHVAHQPHGIEFSPDGKLVYITCENRTEALPPHHPTQGSKIAGFVTIINYTTMQVIKIIEVGAFPAGISVTTATGN